MEMIDLHAHTDRSDGVLSPELLLARAAQVGLSVLAITDHESIESHLDESVRSQAEKLGLELVPGIEFSTRDEEGRSHHIVGLFIDTGNLALHGMLADIQQQRHTHAQQIIDSLQDDGWVIDISKQLEAGASITKGNISRAIVDEPANEARLIDEFGSLPTEGEFTETMLIEDKPHFIPKPYDLSPKEAVSIIREAGGVSIYAHPTFRLIKGQPFKQLCSQILEFGVDGVEAVNIQFDRRKNDRVVEHIKKWQRFARNNDLLISGGSDFHTDGRSMGRFVDLGFANYADIEVKREWFEAIRERAEENKAQL